MNTDDINLAYKIRHALNEQLDALPESTTDRLAQARARAMARKKADAPGHEWPKQAVRSGWLDFGTLLSGQALSRVAVAVPLLALVIGMGGVYQHEPQERLADLADIDAAVLADELPLTAYLDTGFPAYLESQQRQQ